MGKIYNGKGRNEGERDAAKEGKRERKKKGWKEIGKKRGNIRDSRRELTFFFLQREKEGLNNLARSPKE